MALEPPSLNSSAAGADTKYTQQPHRQTNHHPHLLPEGPFPGVLIIKKNHIL